MDNNQNIDEMWDTLVEKLSRDFVPGDRLDIKGILFLIGVQELGKGMQKFSKEDKIDLIHIGVCKVLEPYGYYAYSHHDEHKWPHFSLVKNLPHMTDAAQENLMREAIIDYFEE